MTKQDKINRIQFLEAMQGNLKSILAQLFISGNRVGAVVPDGSYNLNNPRSIAQLISDLDNMQNAEKLNVYTSFLSGVNGLTGLGISQLQGKLPRKVDLTPYMGQVQAKVRAFLDDPQFGKLSDAIWTDKDKLAVYRTLLKGIKEGKSAFQIGQDISNVVSKGVVKSNIERVANTELVRAYNKGSYDTLKEIQRDYEEDFDTYVDVYLSPYHPEEDICDDLVGRYEVGDAPIPPHHPNCLCGFKEVIVAKGKGRDLKEIPSSLREEITFL